VAETAGFAREIGTLTLVSIIAGMVGAVKEWPLVADIVEKVFLGRRTKILMNTEAFFARRREGPHRFSEKRPRSFGSALEKIAAAETSKNPHLRDFWGRSIFDFFNYIGANRPFIRKQDLVVDKLVLVGGGREDWRFLHP
jgi:hypothetical protein